MPLFFKKKKGNLQTNGFTGYGSNYFMEAIERKKKKLAGWLNRKTAGYSPFQNKFMLAIVCILFGVSSLYILCSHIRGHSLARPAVILQHIRSGMPVRPSLPVSDSLFKQAEKTKEWLDSVRRNDTLKFKTILLYNPALPDNLQLIEHIYQSQIR